MSWPNGWPRATTHRGSLSERLRIMRTQSHSARAASPWLLAWACAVSASPAPGGDWRWPLEDIRAPSKLNCGFASVLTRIWLGRGSLDPVVASEAVAANQPAVDMLALRDSCRAHGLKVQGVRISVDELAADQGWAIVLAPANHFELMDAVTDKWVRVYNGGQPRLVAMSEFRQQYQGYALVPEGGARPGPRDKNRDVLQRPIWELSTLAGGQLIHFSLPVRNEASESLRITELCQSPRTTPAAPLPALPVDVPPHGVTNLDLLARVREWPVAQSHWALRTTSRNHPVIVVSAVALVDSVVSVRPAMLDYGPVARGEAATMPVEVVGLPHRGVRVTRIDSGSGEIQSRVTYEAEDDEGYRCTLEVELRPREERGEREFNDRLTIHTNYGPVPAIRIPVRAQLSH